jgi:hypothetical protein
VGGNHQAALIRVIHLPHALDLPQVDSPGPSYIDGVNTKGDGVGAETFGLDTGYWPIGQCPHVSVETLLFTFMAMFACIIFLG